MAPKKFFSFSKKKAPAVVEVSKDSEGAATLEAAAPPTEQPPPPVAPPATSPPASEEQTYELEVPPGTKPGSKLKLTIPGLSEKVVITVPPGAEPGRTISFTLPKNKTEVNAKLVEQTKAATNIQARYRGKAARQVTMSKIEAVGKSAAPASPTYAQNFEEAPKPAATGEEESGGFLSGLGKSIRNLLGAFQAPPDEPAVDPGSAGAFALSALAARAISAWEHADFDTFAALADTNVTVNLPGSSESGMTGVWAARGANTVDGLLSIDTVMVQVDDDELTATVVAMEHTSENEAHGMPEAHAWLRMGFKRAEASAPWKLADMSRDPIWPHPTQPDGVTEVSRLGEGRTLGGCTDMASLAAVALTSLVAGDRPRFEQMAAADVAVRFKALGVEASGVQAAWDGRSKLLDVGNLIAVNSTMMDTDGAGNSSVLAHAHLYDVGAGESSGRPTAHFAVKLAFTGGVSASTLQSVIGDVIWMDEAKMGAEYETEGLAFDNPPVQSIYTRALTFVKAWETHAEDSLRALTSPAIELAVPRYSVSKQGIDDLLKYRSTLQNVGMLTVDSVRVTDTKFEAYLHEYGVEVAQHGLPRMHAGLVLDFTRDEATKEMKVSRMALDVEFSPPVRRQSTFKDVGADVQLSQEL